MSEQNRLDRVFESAAGNKATTSIPTICSLVLGIVICILSIIQAFPTYPKGIASVINSDIRDLWYDTCSNDVIEYLSPFHFDMDGAIYSCPWRTRNTIYRTIVAGVMSLAALISLIILFSGKFSKAWPIFYWLNWSFFVLMFAIFVLDCDGINTGINSCRTNFEVDGDTIIVEESSGSSINVDQCFIEPFIYTALLDFIASIMCYCAYRISKFYIFDPYEQRQRTAKTSTNSIAMDRTNNNNNNNGNTAAAPSTQPQPTAVPNAGSSGSDEPDQDNPFADFQGSYDVDDGSGGAYGGNTRKSTGGGYKGRLSAYDE